MALNRLARESLVYGLGGIASKALSLITLPIVANLMPVEGFGQIEVISVWIAVGVYASTLGIDAAVGFYLYKAATEQERLEYVGTALAFRLFVSGALVVIGVAAAPSIAALKVVFGDSAMRDLVTLGAFVVPLDNLLAFYSDLARLKLRPVLYNVLTLGRAFVYTAGVVALALVTSVSAESLLWVRVAATLVVVLLAVPLFRAELRVCLDRRLLARLLRYGLPLVPTSIAFWVLASSDKLALNWFTTTYALGIFSMAQRVSGLLTFVIGPVQMAWGPYALSISNNADAKERYAETMGLMVPFTLMSVLGLAALAKPIIVVFATREFLAADPLVGLLALAAALNTLYSFAGVGLVLTGKTHLISVGFMLAAGLTLVLNILLCPVLGMHGVAIASCVGHGTALGAVSVMSQRAYPIPYRRRSLVVSAMLFVPTLAAITMLDGEGVWASTCARLGVVAVFAIGLFATGAVNSAKITSSLGIFAKGKV